MIWQLYGIYIEFSKVSGLMNFGERSFLLESRMDIGLGGYLWLVKTYAEFSLIWTKTMLGDGTWTISS